MRDRIFTGLTILLLVGCGEATGDAPGALVTGGTGADTGGTATGTGAGAGFQSGGSGGVSGGTQTPTGATSGVPTNSGGYGVGGSSFPAGGATVVPGSGGATVTPGSGGATVTPGSGGATVTPTSGGAAGSGGGAVTSGGTGTGVSSCVQGVQTGSACDPTIDTTSCVRTDRTCQCSGTSWTCTPNGTNSGGASSGGASSGGASSGGASSGGASSGGGGSSSGGGGSSSGGSGGGEVDCNAAMPTSGAEAHSATWAKGGSGNTAWQVWSNGGPGTVTTYGSATAFTASWNNSGDYLGRMGYEWDTAGKVYTEYGKITADYSFTKSGSAGQYSYVGIYGWSNNPCIEWYIVEDSFHQMPFNTGNQPSGTAVVDGGTYNLVFRTTSGTGGDRCGGAGSWNQYYSIRQTGKQCGTITVSEHFDAWAAKGWNLGKLLEVKIVVEAAGGQGKVDFPVANVRAENP